MARGSFRARFAVRPRFIASGKPVQNGLVARFSGRLRDEWFNPHRFRALWHASEEIAAWRHHDNSQRRHPGLGYRTPMWSTSSPRRRLNLVRARRRRRRPLATGELFPPALISREVTTTDPKADGTGAEQAAPNPGGDERAPGPERRMTGRRERSAVPRRGKGEDVELASREFV